jgi:thiamine biosynthesis protein ThiI
MQETSATPTARQPASGEPRILMSYGELALKGRNLGDFKQRLVSNIRLRLADLPGDWPAAFQHDRVFVEVPAGGEAHVPAAIGRLHEVAGLASIAPARWYSAAQTGQVLRPDYDLIEGEVLALAERHFQSGASFRVRVNRADKRFPARSNELERRLGALIIERTDWDRVSLKTPDRVFYVSIYPEGMYFFAERLRGMGGLPTGSGGRVLALLSGGIDSPVAAWLMTKRGCAVDFVHFTATHSRELMAENNKVVDMARHLSRYTLRSRLYLLPYTHFDLALMESDTDYGLVLFRRFMARTAERLCRDTGGLALVSGDSLGQVASQTLENMVSNSRAIELPILRPLVGMDKLEIIDLAKRIGTYEDSIKPYKDCCALIEREPRTRSRHDRLESFEQQKLAHYERLIQDTLGDGLRLDFECGRQVDADTPDPLRQRLRLSSRPGRKKG